MDRSVSDLNSGLTGTFTGTATFARSTAPADDGALHHHERGILTWGGLAPVPASRDLLWRPARSAHSVDVFFPDGRFFHRLDLATGSDFPVHLCSPDVYRGHFLLQDINSWQYSWRATGPRKDLLLTTRLTRVHRVLTAPSGGT